MDETTETPAAILKASDDPEERSKAAAILGRSNSEAKIAAAQENGKKGGKPKGTKDTEETRLKRIAAWERRRAAKAAQEANNQ